MSQQSINDKQVTIVGAGLVGSLLAVMLGKRGYQVSMLESRPDMRQTDIAAGRSINLALANRGIQPLLEAGVMDRVIPDLITMRGRMIHDEQGKEHLQPYGQREHEVIYSVSRGDLNKILMTAAEETGNVNIEFNQEVTDVNFANDQLLINDRVTRTESVRSFGKIIGADGANSPVRQAIMANTESMDDFQNVREPLGHSYKELCIPAGDGGDFLIEKEALHIWPRGKFMLIALPNPDASFTVTLFLPNEGDNSFAELTTPEAVTKFFHHYFADALELIPNLTEQFFENPTGSLATIRARPWSFDNRALILGDAAHAIVPFHGQGMNCGFEDCGEFIRLLESGNDDWNYLSQHFETNRKDNADAIADMAIENYIEMRDSVRDPNYLLKKELGFELEKRWPDRFIPRYSMVMFNLMPYAEAKRRGLVQNQIMEELIGDKTELSQLDILQAEALIMERLEPVEVAKKLI